MRRLLGSSLLGLLCAGCYLFSDEPKARKRADDPPPTATQDAADTSAAEQAVVVPAGDPTCPELLTGVEATARTIASTCPPVRVRGQYVIDGGSLTIAAGVELRFEPGAVLEVGRDKPGTLAIAGTPEQPVRMVADSSTRPPVSGLPGAPAADSGSDTGRWQGVRLHAQAGGSSIVGLEISGASSPDHGVLWIAADNVRIEAAKIRSIGTRALELVSETPPTLTSLELFGTGPVVRSNPTAVASLQDTKLEPGAWVEIMAGAVHSTIEWPANVYRLDGVVRIEGEAERPAQLSLAPGSELLFGPDARVIVGGLGPGSLSASAPAQPEQVPGVPTAIRLRAAEGELPGAWSGLLVQDQGSLSLRNVELAFGGARDEGVIVAEGSASLLLEGCTLRSNLVGVELRGTGVTLEGLTGCNFAGTRTAIRTTPTLLGRVGTGNTYDADARIDVERGKIEQAATWSAQAATVAIHGDVFVDKGAALVVSPGVHLTFDPGVQLGVGYYEQATLDMRGTADQPIVLAPSTPEASWGGIVLGAHASKCRFEHVSLRKTSNAAAIELRDTADATLVNVDCAACAGAVAKWDCKSTVGNIGVQAHEGTPTTLLPPDGCK